MNRLIFYVDSCVLFVFSRIPFFNWPLVC
jgi:hypothetical protein